MDLTASDLERLARLADAYGVETTSFAVADAVMASAHFTATENERGAVEALVSLLVARPDSFSALETVRPLPVGAWNEMTRTVAHCSPGTPAASVTDIVLSELRFTLPRSKKGTPHEH